MHRYSSFWAQSVRYNIFTNGAPYEAESADSKKSRCEKKHTMWKLKRNIAANEFHMVWK